MTQRVQATSLLRLIVGATGVVIFLAALHWAASIVNLVLLALLITLVALPFKRLLQRRGLSPRLAYALTLLAIFVTTGLIVVVGFISIGQVVVNTPTYIERFQQKMGELVNSAASAGVDLSSLESGGQQAVRAILARVGLIFVNSVGYIVFLAFVLLVVIYMLAEAEKFGALLERTVGADNPIYQNMASSLTAVITYFTITAWINLLIAGGCVILLLWLGIPYALLWGGVFFFFGFIPHIGYWVAILPPLMLAFGMGGVGPALVVLLGYWVINGIFSQLVAPRLYGKGLNLSVTLTVIAVLFWGWLLGSIGGMLAVPLTALIRSALLASYPETAWLATVLSDSNQESTDDKAAVGPGSTTTTKTAANSSAD